MFWVAVACSQYGSVVYVLSVLSIATGISIDPVGMVEAGEK